MTDAVTPLIEKTFSSTWRSAVLTLLLVSAIYLPFLGSRPLLGSDEPRVAAISAEMARYGDWIEPTLNGKPFLEIPPMHWWLSATIFKIFGESVAAAKLPTALAAIAAALCVFFLANSAGLSRFASFLCAMILASAPEFWIVGRRCIMDMALCAFTALAFLAFFSFVEAEARSWRRALWLGVFWAGLSGALLSKGVLGLGIPCSGVFVWLLIRRERSFAVWAGLFGAAALSLVPVGLWLLALWKADGLHAVKVVAVTNNLGRFTGGHAEHVEPFYYYFTRFPAQFLPWTVAMLAGLLLLAAGKLEGAGRKAALFGTICFAVPFVALCVAAGKRAIYLLPLYPLAALLAAVALEEGLKRLDSKLLSKLKAASIALFLLVAAALVFADAFAHGKTMKKSSSEPAFKKCAELLASGRKMALHSPQERLSGGAVFHLGRRFQEINGQAELKDFLSGDPNNFAIADGAAFEKLQGVRLLSKTMTDKDSYLAVFDMEPEPQK